jgi:hypothetical protein
MASDGISESGFPAMSLKAKVEKSEIGRSEWRERVIKRD